MDSVSWVYNNRSEGGIHKTISSYCNTEDKREVLALRRGVQSRYLTANEVLLLIVSNNTEF